jgi:hypothetical protein
MLRLTVTAVCQPAFTTVRPAACTGSRPKTESTRSASDTARSRRRWKRRPQPSRKRHGEAQKNSTTATDNTANPGEKLCSFTRIPSCLSESQRKTAVMAWQPGAGRDQAPDFFQINFRIPNSATGISSALFRIARINPGEPLETSTSPASHASAASTTSPVLPTVLSASPGRTHGPRVRRPGR